MIPTYYACFQLMDDYRMLDNIKAHSIVVAQIAELIARAKQQKGLEIANDLVVSAALLHDIGKSLCLDNSDNHARVGRDICLRHNYLEVAPIVDQHVILDGGFPDQPISAKEIVYYADKRVTHDQIVSLDQRLSYIIDRYGLGNAQRKLAIEQNFERCYTIEQELFYDLDYTPGQLADILKEQIPTWLSADSFYQGPGCFGKGEDQYNAAGKGGQENRT